VHRGPGLAMAVFRAEPEHSVYNNALLERDLGPAERAQALDLLEAVYAEAGVTAFAAWVHEGDRAMCADPRTARLFARYLDPGHGPEA
jgi:hypothetical protein